jgi:hypothetical protein
MLKNPAGYERYFVGKIYRLSRQVSPDSLLDVCAGIWQRALVDVSGMIRTQLGTHNRPENGRSAWGAL